MTLGAISYSRNSSAKQKSIQDQAAANREACGEQQWRLVEELSDPSSASRFASKVRENWNRVLALLPTIDVIILWEPSRGDRSLTTWAAFLDACRANGVLIHAVNHNRTYDPRRARDYRSLAEDGVDSAYESDKISERVLRGHASSAVSGRPHAPTTYGYLRRYDPTTRAFIEQVEHPEQAAVVRRIFGALAAGESLRAVVRKLNEDGIPTQRGAAKWGHSTVRELALNPAYRPHPDDPDCGIRVHRDANHVGQWPPLATEREFQAVQAAFGVHSEAARHARRVRPPGAIKYLLSGSAEVMTSSCGSMLTGFRSPKGKSGAHYGCKHDSCASGPMYEVDEFVARLVVARMSRRDARHLWVVDDRAARRAAEELSRLRRELAEARESFARPGGISAASMAAKETALEPLIAEAAVRAKPAGAPVAALRLIDAVKMGKDAVRPAWDGLSLLAKREVVAGVFDDLVLHSATVRLTRWTPPAERMAVVSDRITFEWRRPSG